VKAWLLIACAGLALACRTRTALRRPDPDLNRMLEVPRYDVYEESRFFEDRMTMRLPPDGTVPRNAETGTPEYLYGERGGAFVTSFPFELTEPVIRHGRSHFERICSACHGMDGYGNDMVTKHMQRPAPSLHLERIRALPPGKVFSIISNGYGLMPDYAAQLAVRDRWAVVTYVKALERSQYLPLASLPDEARHAIVRRLQ